MPGRETFVTWEEAVGNEHRRQAYLSGVLDRFAEIGIHEWVYIDKLWYDPELESHNGKYGDHQGIYGSGIHVMVTGRKGEHVFTYVNDIIFDYTEDDLLSCIDHESTHSCVLQTELLTIPVSLTNDQKKRIAKGESLGKVLDISEDLYRIAVEIAGFSKQFEVIDQGKRNISDSFHENNIKNARCCYQILHRYENGTITDYDFMKNVERALEEVDTLKYFT